MRVTQILKYFYSNSRIWKSNKSFLVRGKEEIDYVELGKLFNTFDKNKDGKLSINEFKDVLTYYKVLPVKARFHKTSGLK
tara:strand:+ start:83 stop:322 length:240 start_codon:yes stop_codon:yes gene_type:complete